MGAAASWWPRPSSRPLSGGGCPAPVRAVSERSRLRRGRARARLRKRRRALCGRGPASPRRRGRNRERERECEWTREEKRAQEGKRGREGKQGREEPRRKQARRPEPPPGHRCPPLRGRIRPLHVHPFQLRRLRVLRVQQLHRVAAELGHQRARQPRVPGPPAGDGVLGARAVEDAVQGGAGGRVLAEAVADQVGDALGDARQVGFLLGDAEHQGVDTAVGGAEGERAGRRVGEDGAEAEDVARRGDAVAPHLFRRHETGRADQRTGAGEPVPGQRLQGPRYAEVDDAGAVDGHQHVGRLEVAVDDAGGVDVLERVREPGREDPYRTLGQCPVIAPDDLLQARPGDVPGGHPRHLGLGVRVQHGCRPVAADPPRGPHLLPEPRPELLLRGEVLPHQLHGDRAPPVRASQIHVPHATGPEPRQQPVRPDPLRIARPQFLHDRAASPEFPGHAPVAPLCPVLRDRPRIVRGNDGTDGAVSTVP